ncbi:4-alpha-glucanotransferase, partial [Arthrobacter deserti]|nr:4-alpha-glucanotransferase [Arthrobacter deserti]
MNTATQDTQDTTAKQARLPDLARAHGVSTSYQGFDGLPHTVSADTLVKILAALGVRAGTDEEIEAALEDADTAPWRRMLPAAVVAREGTGTLVHVHVPHGTPARLRVVTEDGQEHSPTQRNVWFEPRTVDGVLTGRATFELPHDLPLGWHTLHAESDDAQAQTALIVVPDRLATADPLAERRGWGLAAQLYSVR